MLPILIIVIGFIARLVAGSASPTAPAHVSLPAVLAAREMPVS
jgi:hypothetical protein